VHELFDRELLVGETAHQTLNSLVYDGTLQKGKATFDIVVLVETSKRKSI